jgi:molybdopterin-binding protein
VPARRFQGHVVNRNPKEKIMKVSARNLIPGTVKKVTIGLVNAEVVIDAGGVEIVSVITKESAEAMGLKAGAKVKAMVKATSVMVLAD